MRRALAWTLLLALTTASQALPSAGAQSSVCGAGMLTCATTVSLAITPPSEAIPVGQGQVAIPMTVTYIYTQTLSMSFSDTPIRLRVAALPGWADATISPSTVYAAVNELQGLSAGFSTQRTVTLPATLFIGATADAPAFTAAAIEVQADASANGWLSPSSTKTAISVAADYVGLTQVSVAGDLGLAAGGSQRAPLTVTNLGNGLTTITWVLDHAPKGLEVHLPGDLALQAHQQGGARNSATTSVRIGAPGAFDDGDVVLLARSAYALDPNVLGDAHRVAIHVHHGSAGGDITVQSLGSGAPDSLALQSGLAVAGLAAVAMVARCRRTK